jgi:curved DNA-binding protein CbpA
MFRPSKGLLTRGHSKGIPSAESLPSKVTTPGPHCDVYSSKFKLVVEAYAVLSDRRRRERYDMGEDEDGQNNLGMARMDDPFRDIFAPFQNGGPFGGGGAFGF